MTLSEKLEARYGKKHLSYSSLKKALGDIRYFDMSMKGLIKYSSDALRFGNFYDDMLFMTPEEHAQHYYFVDEEKLIEGLSDKTKASKNIKATKEYKEALKALEDPDKMLMSQEEWKRGVKMVKRLEECGLKENYLSGEFQVEFLEEIPDENGEPVLVKGFLDCLQRDQGRIIDSKSAKSVNKFKWAVNDFRYDIQAYIYTTVFDLPDFYWVVQEKTSPYLPALVKCSEDTLRNGKNFFNDSVAIIHEFLDNPTEIYDNYYESYEI